MKKTVASLITLALILSGCSESGPGDGGAGGMAGTGGMGGAPLPPAVDQTCRDWCANEPDGFSCFDGSPDLVKACYEQCLRDYQAYLPCGDEWIATKDCQLDLECEDLFGDCDSLQEDLNECIRRENNRIYCEANCPEFDIAQCEQDTSECRVRARVAANNYCAEYCRMQDRNECVEEYLLTGACEFDNGGSGGTAGSGGAGSHAACGEGQLIDDSYATDTGSVTCNALDVITVPFRVRLAAKTDGPIGGLTVVDVRVQLTMDEDTVGDFGALLQEALISESSADVDDSEGGGLVNVPATVPCRVDFTADPDDNGTAGPIVVTTPVVVATWTAVDGSIVIEAVDMTFAIAQPVPLTLSTSGAAPACTWITVPTVTLEATPM